MVGLKTSPWLVSLVGIFLFSLSAACGPLDSLAPWSGSDLEGTWYVGGDQNQVASIDKRGGQLEAINEHGSPTRLEYDGRDRWRAVDWGGITGEVRGDRIEWSNNTYWVRGQRSTAGSGQLEGTWYASGDRNQAARIENQRGQLVATNERGSTSRLEYDSRGRWRAVDWGGITAVVRGNEIAWSNNSYWTRTPRN